MSPLVLFLVLATTTPAAAADDVILSRAPYRYTAWDSLPRPERSVDRAAFEEARSDSRFSLERITYRSDSLRVAAYLARPAGTLSSRQPCVVYVRGSWRVGDIGWQLAPMFRRLVRAGFLVLAPLLRGSDGEAGVDDMGGADLDDLMRALPVAVASGADSSRMFLYGESAAE